MKIRVAEHERTGQQALRDFFDMTRQGYGVSAIATAIDIRLNDMLPTGHFLAVGA